MPMAAPPAIKSDMLIGSGTSFGWPFILPAAAFVTKKVVPKVNAKVMTLIIRLYISASLIDYFFNTQELNLSKIYPSSQGFLGFKEFEKNRDAPYFYNKSLIFRGQYVNIIMSCYHTLNRCLF